MDHNKKKNKKQHVFARTLDFKSVDNPNSMFFDFRSPNYNRLTYNSQR